MKNQKIIVLILILAIPAAFFGGTKYQQSKTPSRQMFPGSAQGFRAGMITPSQEGGRLRQINGGAVIGQIISADDQSITLKLPDDSNKIVVVSDSTSINKSASATRQDLSVGKDVAIFGTANSDGTLTAQSIQLDPNFRSLQPSPDRSNPAY